jgi:hypothetical protein
MYGKSRINQMHGESSKEASADLRLHLSFPSDRKSSHVAPTDTDYGVLVCTD